jgi:transcriptional adapter 3
LTSARDRVAHNEYVDGRDALDKNITSIYTKLWNKDQPHIEEKKDKKKKSAPKIPTLPKHAAAHGLLLDDELNLVVPDNLKQLAATRRLWVDQVGKCFDAIEADHPGRIRSFPRSSVYEGIEEEVREEVERVPKWQPILRQPSPEPEPSGDAAASAAAEAAAMDAVELPDNWLDMDMEDIGAAMDLA